MHLRQPSYRSRLMATLFLLLAAIGLRIAFDQFAKNKVDVPYEFLEYHDAPQAPKNYTLRPFDPNIYTAAQWMSIGFSEKQAASILKYKEVVGGRFTSRKQLAKCYAISDEKFAELQPFVLLPADESKANFEKKPSGREVRATGPFNPNNLTANGWMKLGFSERQEAAIMKYKQYLGGAFRSKEDIKRCFVIDGNSYLALHRYILLPDQADKTYVAATERFVPAKKITITDFDPNELDMAGWQQLGFSEKQAAAILNYKKFKLKGRFSSSEDLKSSFVVSPEKYAELAPHIKIKPQSPSSVVQNTPAISVATIKLNDLELNTVTAAQLISAGVTPKIANNIVSYRKQLGGYVNKNQIYEVFLIDRAEAEDIERNIKLNAALATKYTLLDAPESWLKTHPYFKYSADKILYYRISEKNERKIWKMMNIKPEYEAKMRLYLR